MQRRNGFLRQILRGAGISFIFSSIGYALIFAFRVLAARYLGPADYGVYELIATVVGLSVTVGSLGVMSAIPLYVSQYRTSKAHGELRGLLRYVFGVQLLGSVLFVVLALIGIPWLTAYFQLPPSRSWLLVIALAFVPFRIAAETFTHIFYAHKRVVLGSFGANVIDKLILLCGLAIAVWFSLGVEVIVVTVAVGSVALLAINSIIYARTIRLPRAKPVYRAAEWFSYSTPVYFSGIAFFILSWTDNFIIAGFLDARALGLYSVAFSLASYIVAMPTLFVVIFVPVLAEIAVKHKAEYAAVFERVRLWGFLAAALIGTPVLFFAARIILALFGQEYLGAATSLIILSAFFLCIGYFAYYNVVLMVEKDTKFLFWNTIVFAGLNLVLALVLVHVFHSIIGLAVSTGLSLFGARLSEFIRARRYMRTRIEFSVLTRLATVCVISAGVMELAFRTIFAAVPLAPWVKLGASFGLYVCVFIGLTILLKLVSADDLEMIQHLKGELLSGKLMKS